MSTNLSTAQQVRKTVIKTKGGVVSAQHSHAARVGAEILAEGGDAVDAAVATSFALGVLEPWMSGPTGGGAMMLWRADEEQAHSLNYGMRSPGSLDPADYPLSGTGKASDLFPWEAVVDDRNIRGATAVAVPGLIDGVGKAHERFGRMPWRDLIAPSVELARKGLQVDWYAALIIASATRSLAQDPDAAALFLEDGQWPTIAGWTSLEDKRIPNPKMADTLSQLAEQGAREFYEGDIAAAMVADMQTKGGCLSMEDLRNYHAAFESPLSFAYRDARFHATPYMTAGPTFRDAFQVLSQRLEAGGAPTADSFAAYAKALKQAYEKRFNTMGDHEEPKDAPGCTTHFSVVDRHGNMVAQTQTLLSIFGARTVSGSTGLLMNNGIMWFDPEQGRPNSLGPDKRCLMNICPVIGEQGNRRFALGASGGRKIVSAVAQLSSLMVDHGLSLEDSFHHPRIDVSGQDLVVADEQLDPSWIEALRQEHKVITAPRTAFPFAYACPVAVLREGDQNMGCTEIMSAWGDSISEPN